MAQFISDEEMNALQNQSQKKFISDEEMKTLDASTFQSKIQRDFGVSELSEEQKLQNIEAEKYDNPLVAGALAAASASTFGLSDAILTGTKAVKPETLKKFREYNEEATLAGEVVGIGGSLFVPGSLVGRVAQLGSKISTKAAAKIGTRAGESTVEKIAKKALAASAGSAVEGAFYGTGKIISESALGTPPENASNILADVGMSTLLGGGLGFLFKGAGEGVPLAYRKLADASSPKFHTLTNKLTNTYADFSSFLSGADKEYNRKLFAATPEGKIARENQISFLTREQELARELSDVIKEHRTTFKANAKEFYDKAQPAERLIINEQVPIEKALASANELAARNRVMIKMMRGDRISFPKSKVDKLEGEAERFEKRMQSSLKDEKQAPKLIYEQIEQYKKELDKYIPYGKFEKAIQQDFTTELENLRYSAKNILEDQTIWGEAAVRQAAINDSYSLLKGAEKEFMKKFGKIAFNKSGKPRREFEEDKLHAYITKLHKQGGDGRSDILDNYIKAMQDFSDITATGEAGVINSLVKGKRTREEVEKELSDLNIFRQGNWYNERQKGFDTTINTLGLAGLVGGAVSAPIYAAGSALYGLARDPAKALRIMHFIEQSKDKTVKFIDKNTKSFLKNENVEKFGKTFKGDLIINQDSMEKKREQYEKNLGMYSNFQSNPEAFQTEVADKLGPLQEVAPETMQALTIKMGQALEMLGSSIPKKSADDFLNLRDSLPPSDHEISQFANVERLVQQPLSILDDLQDGTITAQNTAVIQELYPEIYGQIVSSLMRDIVDSKPKLDYTKRMNLSILFGKPLDSSLSPQFITSIQMMHSPQTAQVMAEQQKNDMQEFNPTAFSKTKGKQVATPLQNTLA